MSPGQIADPASPRPAEPATETELKLRFAPADLAKILDAALLSARQIGERRVQSLVSTYYDTSDLALSAAHTVIRIRVQGDRLIQTIKTQGHGEGGLAPERGEWEWPVAGNALDLAGLDATNEATAKLIRAAAPRLKPIFASEIERTECRIGLADGGVAVAAIDNGQVRSGETAEPVSELELELESGSVAALFHLALELAQHLPLTISLETKSAIGYRLAAGAPHGQTKARPVELSSAMTAGAGFRRIIQSCLTHLLENQPAVLGGADAGGIHQMRVALRRMRAAIALFEGLLAPERARDFDAQLRSIARLFGEARDLDVLATELLPRFGRSEAHRAQAGLLADMVEPYRSDAHDRVVTEIGGRGYTRLILSLAAWAAEEGEASAHSRKAARRLDRRIDDAAPDLLEQRLEAALKRGKHVARDAEARHRHALRKALKKLRYGVEFLGSLYPAEAVSAYLAPLEELQDRLGELNDAAMALEIMPGLAGDGGKPLAKAAAALEDALAKRAADSLDELPAAWARFKEAEPFWR